MQCISLLSVALRGVRYEVPLPGVPGHKTPRLPQAQNYSLIYLSHCTESDMKYRSPVGRHTDTGSPSTELLHIIPVALHGVGYEIPLPGGPAHRHRFPRHRTTPILPVALHGVGYEVPLTGGQAHKHQLLHRTAP
jgi:hypothetical protein